MFSFTNDYSEGAHPRIIQRLVDTNLEQTAGYGMDKYCEEAKSLIFKYLNNKNSKIHFLVGGTQTNMTAIAAFLRPHQGIISAHTGHINTHESGAIEATGHKVITLPAKDGKISAQQIEENVCAHLSDDNFEHTVQPKMVYLSNPTEVGTIYTKAEMTAISIVCRKYNLILYVDGARLGCALTAKDNDLTLEDFAALTDAFYIGGTKMGALFGEALVINTPSLQEDFRYILKQRGGMLAKGRLLGIQFYELFSNSLYFDLANHANNMAEKLTRGIEALGIPFLVNSTTNQVFPIFPDEILEKMEKDYHYSFWEKTDANHSAIRLCTSFSTPEDKIDQFLKDLKNYYN